MVGLERLFARLHAFRMVTLKPHKRSDLITS